MTSDDFGHVHDITLHQKITLMAVNSPIIMRLSLGAALSVALHLSCASNFLETGKP